MFKYHRRLKIQKYYVNNPLVNLFYYSNKSGFFFKTTLVLPREQVILKMRRKNVYQPKLKNNAK